MRIEEKAETRSVSGPGIAVSLAIGTIWLAGCAGRQAVDLGESHPANPRAAAAPMTLPARRQIAARSFEQAQVEPGGNVLAVAAAVRAVYYRLVGDAQLTQYSAPPSPGCTGLRLPRRDAESMPARFLHRPRG